MPALAALILASASLTASPAQDPAQGAQAALAIGAPPATHVSSDSLVPPGGREWSGGRTWRSWTRMTGDWGGARATLEARAGATVQAASDAELSADGRAGLVQLSTLALAGQWPWLHIRSYAELRTIAAWGPSGGFPSRQGLSNLTAPGRWGPGEAWVEVSGAGGQVRLKAGRTYATADFASVGTAAPFFNPSFGLSPALASMAAYPDPAPGITAFARPVEGLPQLAAALYRGRDGAPALLAQLHGSGGAWGWSLGALGALSGAAGPARDAAPGPRTPPGITGAFLTAERSPADGRPGAFLVLAQGRGPGGAAARHLAAGWVLERDWALSACAAGGALSAYGAADTHASELVPEAFIRLQPMGWLYLQPDLQLYLPLAGAAPAPRPRLAGLLRFGVRY